MLPLTLLPGLSLASLFLTYSRSSSTSGPLHKLLIVQISLAPQLPPFTDAGSPLPGTAHLPFLLFCYWLSLPGMLYPSQFSKSSPWESSKSYRQDLLGKLSVRQT